MIQKLVSKQLMMVLVTEWLSRRNWLNCSSHSGTDSLTSYSSGEYVHRIVNVNTGLAYSK